MSAWGVSLARSAGVSGVPVGVGSAIVGVERSQKELERKVMGVVLLNTLKLLFVRASRIHPGVTLLALR